VDSSFFLGRYGRRSIQNADTGIRRMERGVSLPSSNPLAGSNFRESAPIGIKSYPAIALLSPGLGKMAFLDRIRLEGQTYNLAPILESRDMSVKQFVIQT
jgi:hypothetical protein